MTKIVNKYLSTLSRRSILQASLGTVGLISAPIWAQSQKNSLKSSDSLTVSSIPFAPLLDTQLVKNWQDKAAAAGVPHVFSTRLLEMAKLQPVVKRYMNPPPPGTRKNWAAYKARFTDTLRIQKGRYFIAQHASTFAAAEEKYGVPSHIIAAIIGVETLYGTYSGNFKLIDVLSTLAFDYPRRADYFQGELLAFMQLVQEQMLTEDARGSFAGALGLPQFMPSSLQKWGVSATNTKPIDLTNSPQDAIMSVASFLAGHGWQRDLPVAFEADGIDESNAGAWLRPDATPVYNYASIAPFATFLPTQLPENTQFAVVDLQYLDLSHDYLLTTQNFHSLMQYNRSFFYASAVWYLSKLLA
jgi:membrane-bound lytic murein transglycosylase B